MSFDDVTARVLACSAAKWHPVRPTAEPRSETRRARARAYALQSNRCRRLRACARNAEHCLGTFVVSCSNNNNNNKKGQKPADPCATYDPMCAHATHGGIFAVSLTQSAQQAHALLYKAYHTNDQNIIRHRCWIPCEHSVHRASVQRALVAPGFDCVRWDCLLQITPINMRRRRRCNRPGCASVANDNDQIAHLLASCCMHLRFCWRLVVRQT